MLSTDPHLPVWSPTEPRRYRRFEATVLVGSGEAVWERTSRDVLTWVVKTRSGFRVADQRRVTPGAELTITVGALGVRIKEPVCVSKVVDTATRVGFSYRTRKGHPVDGEEAFIVHRVGNDVFFTLRSLTAPAAEQPWRALHPLLRAAQVVVRRRYLRALR